MSAPCQWTAVQRLFAFAAPVFIATWLVSVPTLMGTSNFLAAVALFTALGWVAFTTHKNAMPASSLAQSRHDADRGSFDGQRRRRSRRVVYSLGDPGDRDTDRPCRAALLLSIAGGV
jgi:hypothetical protein